MAISSVLGSSALAPAGLGFRNVLINGGFDVWQRGTGSFTMATSNNYTADRWCAYRSASGGTVTRQTTGDTTNLPFIKYCARVQRDSSNTSTANLYFGTSVESANSIYCAGKTITVSFYARAGANYSASSSLLNVIVASGTGTDENYVNSVFTGSTNVISQNATLTTTWQRFIFTGLVASTATQLAVQFTATPVGTASTNDYFEVTGVQLEANTVPTPFEQRPIGTELMLCQRYYEKSYSQTIAPGTQSQNGAISVFYNATYGACGGFQFKVTKKSAPTLTLYAPATGTASRVDSIAYGDSTYTLGEIGDSGIRYLQLGNGTAGAALHYVAVAEL